jgi:2-iminobutanoate/2-iminopropanoate deaminase
VKKELIIPPGTNPDKLVIAPGIRIGDFIYLSGTVGLDPDKGKLAGIDIESQARQAMENLGKILEAAGSSWDKVFKVGCFLTHPKRDFAIWNKVFKEYFGTEPPARTTVGAEIAMEGALIEIELIATV